MSLQALRQSRAGKYLERVAKGFFKHESLSLAAGVAFYTALSFAPIVMIIVTFGGLLGESAQSQLIAVFSEQLGPRASEVTEAVVESAEQDEPKSAWKTAIGVVLLFISASAVFAQLQRALNIIWESEIKPGAGVWAWLRKRLLSMGMVLVILFILLVSLVLSSFAEHLIPSQDGLVGHMIVFAASLVVATILFATLYRVLPDEKVPWSEAFRGALITALLFSVGKLALGLYLDRGSVAKGYGEAAGALIALLVWVYYSCVILFIGAEMTRQLSPKPSAVANGTGEGVAAPRSAVSA